jgi:hypothetical protein
VDQSKSFDEVRRIKFMMLMAILREQPALRDREFAESNMVGYLLEKCGMNKSAQMQFAYNLQARCESDLPIYAIQHFADFTIGCVDGLLARGASLNCGELRAG